MTKATLKADLKTLMGMQAQYDASTGIRYTIDCLVNCIELYLKTGEKSLKMRIQELFNRLP